MQSVCLERRRAAVRWAHGGLWQTNEYSMKAAMRQGMTNDEARMTKE
jgi:hypothetical protein